MQGHECRFTMMLGVALLWATSASAGPTAAQKCEAAKLKIAGKYNFCRLKAEAKAVKTGDPVDYSKCDTNWSIKWTVAEAKGGGMCPTNGDLATMQALVTSDDDGVAACLSGTCPLLNCGDAVIDAGEDCDQGNLGGEDCVTQGFFGGTLACDAGCSFDTSGCFATRFVDNGNSITDHYTGLQWEKKSGTLGATSICPGGASCGDPTNVNNLYSWTSSIAGTPADGTAFTDFLSALNACNSSDGSTFSFAGFAGHCDWRLPTPAELQTILLSPYPCGTNPCIDPIFGPTLSSGAYWSATTKVPGDGSYALGVSFSSGSLVVLPKEQTFSVRAVRKQKGD